MAFEDDKDGIVAVHVVVAACLKTVPGIHCFPLGPHPLSTEDIVHSRIIPARPLMDQILYLLAQLADCPAMNFVFVF